MSAAVGTKYLTVAGRRFAPGDLDGIAAFSDGEDLFVALDVKREPAAVVDRIEPDVLAKLADRKGFKVRNVARIECVGGPLDDEWSRGPSGRMGWRNGGRYLRFDGVRDQPAAVAVEVPMTGGRYILDEDGCRYTWVRD